MHKTGMELIAQERKEQIEKHGWSLEHDQDYGSGQLLQAARFCIDQVNNRELGCNEESIKWPDGWDPYFENKIRNKSIIEQLIVAGAFFMAENDRIGSDAFHNYINAMARKIDMLNGIEQC